MDYLAIGSKQIMPANPLKGGDAKLLVYRDSSYDSRAAECEWLSNKQFFLIAIARL
jgi:hypothetical protein